MGELQGAVALYDQAVAVHQGLVDQQGRGDLRGELACTRVLRAEALLDLGERERARSEARQAMVILEAEASRTQRADLRKVLSWAFEALHTVLDSSPVAAPQQATPVRASGNASPGNAALSLGAIDVYFASSSDTDDGKSETDSRPLHSGQSKTVSERSEVDAVTEVMVGLGFRSE